MLCLAVNADNLARRRSEGELVTERDPATILLIRTGTAAWIASPGEVARIVGLNPRSQYVEITVPSSWAASFAALPSGARAELRAH